MATEKEISAFIRSQRSIWLYPKVRQALKDVLSSMPDRDYRKATKKLILMVLHEGAEGQLMHLPDQHGKFKVLQLSIATKASMKLLRYVIAHELGHAMQGRNWRKGDGNRLEKDADRHAAKWGFRYP